MLVLPIKYINSNSNSHKGTITAEEVHNMVVALNRDRTMGRMVDLMRSRVRGEGCITSSRRRREGIMRVNSRIEDQVQGKDVVRRCWERWLFVVVWISYFSWGFGGLRDWEWEGNFKD